MFRVFPTQKLGGFNTPKMDGEHDGKPYFLMGWFGGFLPTIFGNIQFIRIPFELAKCTSGGLFVGVVLTEAMALSRCGEELGRKPPFCGVWRGERPVFQAVKTHDFWVWAVLVYFFASQQFFTDVFFILWTCFFGKSCFIEDFHGENTQDKDNLFFFLGGEENLF